MIYPSSMSDTVTELREKGWEDKMIQRYCDYGSKHMMKVHTGRQCSTQDSSRQKTYRAEWKFSAIHKYDIKDFENEKEAQKFLKRVVKSKLWAELCQSKDKSVNLTIRKLGGTTIGHAIWNEITLDPRGGMNDLTLLHELAHVAGNRHHDISFRQTFVRLVSRFMGAEKGKSLKKCFRDQGLKMSIRTTMKTPEQWLESVQRLEAARQKLAA